MPHSSGILGLELLKVFLVFTAQLFLGLALLSNFIGKESAGADKDSCHIAWLWGNEDGCDLGVPKYSEQVVRKAKIYTSIQRGCFGELSSNKREVPDQAGVSEDVTMRRNMTIKDGVFIM